MARKTTVEIVSDLSGKRVDERNAATLTVRWADGRKGTAVLDITEQEADEYAAKGVRHKARGRKPKSQ
jgi:hypothetical protein